MKQISVTRWGSVGLLTLIGFLTGCANTEPAMQEEMAVAPKTSTTKNEAKKIIVEVIEPQQEIIEADSVVEQKLVSDPVSAPVLSAPVLDPLMPPELGGDDFMDAAHKVDPWLANYVGSYGLLPTRFQDKGPFLYSFDVEPDGDY